MRSFAITFDTADKTGLMYHLGAKNTDEAFKVFMKKTEAFGVKPLRETIRIREF